MIMFASFWGLTRELGGPGSLEVELLVQVLLFALGFHLGHHLLGATVPGEAQPAVKARAIMDDISQPPRFMAASSILMILLIKTYFRRKSTPG